MALRLFFGLPAVLVCLAATASMAFRFGWGLGAEDLDRWIYAGAGVAVDVIKALLPLLIIWAWHARPRRLGYCIMAAAFFLLFTGYSLLASFGLAAIQSASKIGAHTAVATMYRDRREELERRQAERAALPTHTPTDEAAVKAGQRAADTATATRIAECGNGDPKQRGKNCRDYEAAERRALADLATATANKATTDRAAEMEAKITAAQAALAEVDVQEATKEADPQAAAMAILVGRFIGNDKERIRTAIQALLALVLEAGSGFGFYLVFGSHAPRRRDEPDAAGASLGNILAHEPGEQITIETPADGIERFFRERVRPALSERVPAAAMYANYEIWCGERGSDPVSANSFGRMAPWRKERAGGRIWYLDATLASAAPSARPRLAIDNALPSRALGKMVTVGAARS